MDPRTPRGQNQDAPSTGYALPRQQNVIQPLQQSDPINTPDPSTPTYDTTTMQDKDGNLATNMIRQKLSRLYGLEPNAKEEIAEVAELHHRTKHQDFMYQLQGSGKSLADIQTAWHNYYVGLPENEKHEVWQEFYAAHAQAKQATMPHSHATESHNPEHSSAQVSTAPATNSNNTPKQHSKLHKAAKRLASTAPRTTDEIRGDIIHHVQSRRKITRKQHVHSILFGLATGVVAIIVMLFSFFNDRILAPFMTPSRAIADASIIIDPSNTKVGDQPQVIIPKINVQIPAVYDVDTIEEQAIQTGLERGVVHYATTPNPGEKGNGVIFGHSANNILNKGQYKFAFVLLHKLEIGDTFYVDYQGTRYAYQIFDRKIVPPTDVSVLNPTDKSSTFTLITCDPPGTALKRLVIVGEQISPDPGKNTLSKVNQNTTQKPAELPSNAPSLWSRLWSWL